MLIASTIGQILQPFYTLFAWILAEAYALIPNYAIAIAILTLVVMVAAFPINLKQTRGMMKMQLLAPEMKKLQAKYKASPGLTVGERQELRQRQQEETMALYKENNVSPAGGCLPALLQMPVFIVLYGTIRGLVYTVNGVSMPRYISHSSQMYQDIQAAGGKLVAFGINLADSVRTPGLSAVDKIPFAVLILVAIALQYLQIQRLSGRNPQAVNPQMQQMQKVLPLVFAIFYISVPAAINIYFIVSNLFRIGQQELMYRRDPHIQQAMSKLRAQGGVVKATDAGGPAKGSSTKPPTSTKQLPAATENGSGPSANGEKGSRPRPGYTPPRSASGPPPHPRAQGKRPRRSR